MMRTKVFDLQEELLQELRVVDLKALAERLQIRRPPQKKAELVHAVAQAQRRFLSQFMRRLSPAPAYRAALDTLLKLASEGEPVIAYDAVTSSFFTQFERFGFLQEDPNFAGTYRYARELMAELAMFVAEQPDLLGADYEPVEILRACVRLYGIFELERLQVYLPNWSREELDELVHEQLNLDPELARHGDLVGTAELFEEPLLTFLRSRQLQIKVCYPPKEELLALGKTMYDLSAVEFQALRLLFENINRSLHFYSLIDQGALPLDLAVEWLAPCGPDCFDDLALGRIQDILDQALPEEQSRPIKLQAREAAMESLEFAYRCIIFGASFETLLLGMNPQLFAHAGLRLMDQFFSLMIHWRNRLRSWFTNGFTPDEVLQQQLLPPGTEEAPELTAARILNEAESLSFSMTVLPLRYRSGDYGVESTFYKEDYDDGNLDPTQPEAEIWPAGQLMEERIRTWLERQLPEGEELEYPEAPRDPLAELDDLFYYDPDGPLPGSDEDRLQRSTRQYFRAELEDCDYSEREGRQIRSHHDVDDVISEQLLRRNKLKTDD